MIAAVVDADDLRVRRLRHVHDVHAVAVRAEQAVLLAADLRELLVGAEVRLATVSRLVRDVLDVRHVRAVSARRLLRDRGRGHEKDGSDDRASKHGELTRHLPREDEPLNGQLCIPFARSANLARCYFHGRTLATGSAARLAQGLPRSPSRPGWASAARTRIRSAAGRGKRVAVLGGGMAGLAAAHELVERGFSVDVYERKALGGKARSIPVAGTAARRPQARCPASTASASSPASTTTSRTRCGGSRSRATRTASGTTSSTRPRRKSPRTERPRRRQVFGIAPDPNEALHARRACGASCSTGSASDGAPAARARATSSSGCMVFVTSCDERRYGEWEHTSWWDFIKAEDKSDEYKKVARPRPDARASSPPRRRVASTRTIGNMAEAFVMNIMGRGNDGAPDRVLERADERGLDRPVGAAAAQARRALPRRPHGRGARDARRRGRVGARRATADGRRRTIEADWFVCAMPAERARRLWSRAVLAHDPVAQAGMDELYVDWMNGIQFYLRKPLDIIRGHLTFVDAPWALTALTQAPVLGATATSRATTATAASSTASRSTSPTGTRPGSSTASRRSSARRSRSPRRSARRSRLHLNDNGEDDPHRRHGRTRGTSTRRSSGRAGARRNSQRRAAARQHRRHVGEAPARRRPRSRTCSWPATTCRPTSTWRRWRARTSPAAPPSNALLEASGSKAEPAAMYKLYDPPEFEAAKARGPRAVQAGPAERARQGLGLSKEGQTPFRSGRPSPARRTSRPAGAASSGRA